MKIFNQYDTDGLIDAVVEVRSSKGVPDPVHPRQFEDDEGHPGRLHSAGKIYDIEKDANGLPIKAAGKWKKGTLVKTL